MVFGDLTLPREKHDSCSSDKDMSKRVGSRHSTRASEQLPEVQAMPALPEPLTGAEKIEVATLKDVPTAEDLAAWLTSRGVDITGWGVGNTKTVDKFWKELKLDEAGLEVWRRPSGEALPVRTTHVLRAKVCSPESYKNGIFLFNTWQQYGDGRTRVRNGLLSEKLSMTELPLEDHLAEVCQRAVTEEEMQRVCEAHLKIGPNCPAPTYDRDYKCPLTVVDQHNVDLTIEVEVSKSYPGLLTMYYLYTVEIVCTGLPITDFNTLEFEAPDKNGDRKLKYVHAWVWLDWTTIRRYLLEGSKMKERKKKGSFNSAYDLLIWLKQFDMALNCWGQGTNKTVDDLFEDIERSEAHLELWGRSDGVPIVMRVQHVLELQVKSADPRLHGRVLMQAWRQNRDGNFLHSNRLPSRPLNENDRVDEMNFQSMAAEAVKSMFSFPVEYNVRLGSGRPAGLDTSSPANPTVVKAELLQQRVEIGESPSYAGMITCYHLYTAEVFCQALPLSDFGTIDMKTGAAEESPGGEQVIGARGWRWMTWQNFLDAVHQRAADLERLKGDVHRSFDTQANAVAESQQLLHEAQSAIQQLAGQAASGDGNGSLQGAQALLGRLGESLGRVEKERQSGLAAVRQDSAVKKLPPSMVSEMAQNSLVSESFLQRSETAQLRSARDACNGVSLLEAENRALLTSVRTALSGVSSEMDDRTIAFFQRLDPDISRESIAQACDVAKLRYPGRSGHEALIDWLFETPSP
eukprot:TRINITY_DN80315_c0_g1_i1.p1 TRINITY_DN80315_c0_g1~~TRINITY_DN80315_c0_g1_i1.p1  ORF type:complete len:744 (-),score=178.89 TRINITY_DN80315_c0_g1_i1:127-2358(-)